LKEKTIPFIEVWDLLTNVQSLMNLLTRNVQMQYDLAPQELRIMIELDRTSSMNISKLSKAIHRDFGNVSRTCSTLAKKGLLHRRKSEEDHRVILVELTAKGKKKLEAFYQYNLTVMQCKALENNRDKYEAMMTGMKLFLSFMAKRMEELDD